MVEQKIKPGQVLEFQSLIYDSPNKTSADKPKKPSADDTDSSEKNSSFKAQPPQSPVAPAKKPPVQKLFRP